LNHPRGARVEDGRLVVSKLFQWYIDDFGGNKQSVRDYVIRYAEEDLKTAIARSKGVSYNYSWLLNQP